MKKILLFVLVWLFIFPSVFAKNQVNVRRRVQEQVEKQNSFLYQLVRRELQSYYQRDNFSDPNHQSGWYRVDDFLAWVNIHSKELEDVMGLSVYDESYMQQIRPNQAFWLQLGVRYIASVYGVKADFFKLPIEFDVSDGDGRASSGKDRLKIFASLMEVAPELINDGIHEGTHILPILSSGNTRDSHLDELATFYSQYNYGLPVKASDVRGFTSGIRDIRRTYKLKPSVGAELSSEYNYFIAGIILNPLLTKKEILIRETGGMRAWTNMAIWTTIANLIALRDGNYWDLYETLGLDDEALSYKHFDNTFDFQMIPGVPFYAGEYQPASGEKIDLFGWYDESIGDVFFAFGKRTSEEDYLERLFGNRATALYNFYDTLINNLPDEVVLKARELWPVQADGMFKITEYSYFPGWEQFGKPYSKLITEAVIKTLKEINAPPPPPIPEGYM